MSAAPEAPSPSPAASRGAGAQGDEGSVTDSVHTTAHAALTTLLTRARAALGVATPLEWLLLVVGLGLTWRYFWFMDDAFIYFRYVDNLVFLGRGLVFNPGEYVEAYSSPLWTLLLVPLRATTLDYYTLLRALSLLTCGAFWLTAVHLNRRLCPPGPRASLGVALAMTHYGVLSYFSSGLETPLVQLMACVFALALLSPTRRLWQALAGLAPLVRPELAVPLMVLAGWLFITRRRAPWWLIGVAITTGAAWLGFRIYYYADLFPNTYYLKDQTELSQGLHYLVYSTKSHHLLGVLALGLLAAFVHWLLVRRRARSPGSSADAIAKKDAPLTRSTPPTGRGVRLGLLLCALAATAYPIKVGGDMVYYRFLAFPVCAGFLALSGVLEQLLSHGNVRLRRWLSPALGLTAAGLSLLGYPEKLSAHPATLTARVGHYHGIGDGAWHRQLEELAPSRDRARFDRERRASYRAATPEQLRGLRVEAGGWCAADYRKWDRVIVHEWGLTEPALARATVRADRPGHKLGLKPLARQLALLKRRAALDPRAPRDIGFYRHVAAQSDTPRWIRDNLPALEVIEQKTYNRHVLSENLRLAFARPIVHIPDRQPPRPAKR
ncbi:MAG: hypothetical protein KF915_20590 [Polyangiaceae bacterium]|nr:hypothetical protein [Polyangiaceae bacterium]